MTFLDLFNGPPFLVLLGIALHLVTFAALAMTYRRTGSMIWPAFVGLFFPVAYLFNIWHIAFKRWPAERTV